jgi:arginyl-tRNA synthetase
MNLFNDIRDLVIETLKTMTKAGDLPDGLSFGNVTVEPPRDPLHGDMSTNAAMVLSKPAGQKPGDIAEKLVNILGTDDRIISVKIAGPGFLNIRIVPYVWQSLVLDVLSSGRAYGMSAMGAGQKVNVEYVSANPTGPLHVGHTRGAVFGDALAGLLDYAGYDVTREYYVNDGGSQVDV